MMTVKYSELQLDAKKLDADKVIEWIHKYWPYNWGNFALQADEAIEKFKKDFGLIFV